MKRAKQTDSLLEKGGLGNFVAEHTYRGSRVQRTWMVLGIMCIVIVVAAPIGLILLAVAFLRNYRVRVYACGLELINGNKQTVCRWGDIEAFWQQVTINQATLAGIPVVRGAAIHQYRIRLRNGKEYRFEENYRNVETLGETIRVRTFPLLLAKARAAYDRGEEVEFGSIGVSNERLSQDNRRSKSVFGSDPVRSKSWKELTGFEVRVAEGHFYLDKGRKKTWAGEQFEAMLITEVIADIPNFAVLLTLMAEHLTVPEPIREAFCGA